MAYCLGFFLFGICFTSSLRWRLRGKQLSFEAYRPHPHVAGIGFVFSSADKYTGIDLDGRVDPETGDIVKWAWEWIAKFDSYTEYSPSGTGTHIIVKGKSPHNGRREVDSKKVEIYSTERFFTIRGVRS